MSCKSENQAGFAVPFGIKVTVGTENEVFHGSFVFLLRHGILVNDHREGMIIISAGAVLKGVKILSVFDDVGLELFDEHMGRIGNMFFDPFALGRVGLGRPQRTEGYLIGAQFTAKPYNTFGGILVMQKEVFLKYLMIL